MAACAGLVGAGAAASAQSKAGKPRDDQAGTARADLKDAKGQSIGQAELTSTPNGVLVRVRLSSAPSGAHAIHIHETGKCDPPSFESAGEHLNPRKAMHGYHDAKGPHAGDLPNLHIPQGGHVEVEHLAHGTQMATVLDGDGAALVLHAAADDYKTDPAGNAGDRLACGVIMP